MPTKIGINGFGRIGRLDLRAAFGSEELEFVHINEPYANAKAAAHLLEFDTVHGRWDHEITADESSITMVYPELKGRLNGVAVRVPMLNSSLTDCVFELEKESSVEEVNAALKAASEDQLKGILGYEERPLVSADYVNDPRSGIVDALSTMMVNGTQVKLLVWYDNEWGYSNRMMDLTKIVASSL
jgi:glyceraldehyde-3-phosphate dehydrogenase/erythrose-4-phosphate dehydrogenase